MTWKYLPVLNSMIQILLTVGMGGVFGYAGILNAQDFVIVAVRFVFYVALPCLVLYGVGINVNFYSDKFLWNYFAAFLVLRAIALAVVFIVVLAGNWREREQRRGLGHVAVVWLALTWISTVIMGVPIMTALFGGDPATGQRYGLLAGISSFIFQLPLQLVFLECHTLDSVPTKAETLESYPAKEETKDTSGQPLSKDLVADMDETWSQVSNPADSEPAVETACKISHDKTNQDAAFELVEEPPNTVNLSLRTEIPVKWWVLTGGKYVNRRDVWLDVLRRVVRNPVLWGIFWGFVLSLSTVGPMYLNENSNDFVEGLGWGSETLAWFGDTVSPLSLFAMGVWMQAQGLHQLLLPIPLPKLALYMLSKLVLVPLLMVGIAKAMSLQNEVGRAAVLIATLPISLVSFSLGHQYRIGEAELSANVATGTLLMLPTILVWNLVMDSLNLFPVVATTG
jgi:predicted permease